MLESSSHPAPADRPAATIWEHYRLTREWISEICLVVMTVSLLASLIQFVYVGFDDGFWSSRTVLNPEWWIVFLFAIQSAFCFAIASERLGTGWWALGISFITAALWLITAGAVGYAHRDLRSVDELVELWAMMRGAVLLFLGGSIFFTTYLLSRTNSDA